MVTTLLFSSSSKTLRISSISKYFISLTFFSLATLYNTGNTLRHQGQPAYPKYKSAVLFLSVSIASSSVTYTKGLSSLKFTVG